MAPDLTGRSADSFFDSRAGANRGPHFPELGRARPRTSDPFGAAAFPVCPFDRAGPIRAELQAVEQGHVTVTTNPVPAAPTTQDALHALLCEVLPPQGAWSDDAYLWLTDHSNRLIEFTDGYVQELTMSTFTHQAVLAFLYDLFRAYLKPRGGLVMFAALRMRIRAGKFREPDLLLLRDRADTRCQDRYWLGADLVAEVISPDNPDRDLVEKRADYAEAGIPEYWVVDPRDETIRVLTLQGAAYVEYGVYVRGTTATSPLLEGFAAEVSAVFDAPAARV